MNSRPGRPMEITHWQLKAVSTALVQCSDYYQHESSTEAYRAQLSIATGVAVTAFIAPPVKHCIDTDCARYNTNGSLYRHHPPTTVTIFTMEGPVAATKVNLKCRCCGTIYNYAMYGKKKSEGERFYEVERELVEVTHVAYCKRNIQSLFCRLR